MSSLNREERTTMIRIMMEEGIPVEKATTIVGRLDHELPERTVSITQDIGIVPEGATVVGLRARSIG